MIVKLKGKLEKKDPIFVHVDVNGVVYQVNVSLNTSSQIKSEDIVLYITQIITESSNTLYGFINEEEQNLFNSLLKLNGIGGKVAIAVCSTFIPSTFFEIIKNGDDKLLQKVPGIGSKVAKRIILELSGYALIDSDNNHDLSINNDAIMALESLGFKRDAIVKVIKDLDATSTSQLVKEALKRLQK